MNAEDLLSSIDVRPIDGYLPVKSEPANPKKSTSYKQPHEARGGSTSLTANAKQCRRHHISQLPFFYQTPFRPTPSHAEDSSPSVPGSP